MTTHRRRDIHDHVRELTDVHRLSEPVAYESENTTYSTVHVVSAPPLLDQLSGLTPGGEEPSGQGPGSRPAARIEGLDTFVHIDLAAARWVRDLGEDDPGDTKACVRKLGALWPSAARCGRAGGRRDPETKTWCCAQHEIAYDVRRWWTAARIASGWDIAAWKPDNTCPRCDVRGSLRVRYSDLSAMCVECRELWDEETIGLLAEHIRHENGEAVIGADTPDAETA